MEIGVDSDADADADADVLVVGGGISGIACARRAAAAGLTVRVVDRGRRIGGRMAARTLRDVPGGARVANTGAPYCTVSDDRFRAVVDDWVDRGLAREWTDTLRTASAGGLLQHRHGPMRFAGTSSMRALVEDLAAGLDVRSGETVGPDDVARLLDAGAAVVLAMPGPQAARLLTTRLPELAAVADQPYDPAIALVARYAARTWPRFDGAFVADVDEVRWVADDHRLLSGQGAPVLVAHSTARFAREHLADPDAAVVPMLQALDTVLGIGEQPLATSVQRWTFAQPATTRPTTFHLDPARVGLCGDGWSERSRVEAAWLSGDDLGAALVAGWA